MEFSDWLLLGYGIFLGWLLPGLSRFLFIEIPVQLRLKKDKLYNERKPYGKK